MLFDGFLVLILNWVFLKGNALLCLHLVVDLGHFCQWDSAILVLFLEGISEKKPH